MPDKKTIMIAAGVAVVLAVGIVWYFSGGKALLTGSTGGEAKAPEEPMYEGRPLKEIYSPTVPKGETVNDQAAKSVVPASPNSNLSTKARTFDVKASMNGFEPDSITVNAYDTVQIDFTALGGDYDFTIPYLGINFATVPAGQTKPLVFNASGAGTFTFECSKNCPKSGVIRGTLVIIPQSF